MNYIQSFFSTQCVTSYLVCNYLWPMSQAHTLVLVSTTGPILKRFGVSFNLGKYFACKYWTKFQEVTPPSPSKNSFGVCGQKYMQLYIFVRTYSHFVAILHLELHVATYAVICNTLEVLCYVMSYRMLILSIKSCALARPTWAV